MVYKTCQVLFLPADTIKIIGSNKKERIIELQFCMG